MSVESVKTYGMHTTSVIKAHHRVSVTTLRNLITDFQNSFTSTLIFENRSIFGSVVMETRWSVF